MKYRDDHLPDRDADQRDRSQHERPGRFRHPVVCPLIREDLLLDDPRIHPVLSAYVQVLGGYRRTPDRGRLVVPDRFAWAPESLCQPCQTTVVRLGQP
jgi:hypothetical protein